MSLFSSMCSGKKLGKKQFSVLIDPDKVTDKGIELLSRYAGEAGADYFFVGGSLLTTDSIAHCIHIIKQNSSVPVILFPGNPLQITPNADAILFLSLISGRNPDMLIGNHVVAAPLLRSMDIEVIPTGYMLIDSGKQTTVSYMSNTTPIPADKADIAACTAMAGEMLGLKLIFLDGGSGAHTPVSAPMIKKVASSIQAPLVVGGGIKTPEKAIENCLSGADIIVVGNSIEKEPALIKEISFGIHSLNTEKSVS
jgi:phosphoglycerol geranylgeranyltransferase